MLASGSRGAPYTCLRCQLRQVIFHTPGRCIDRTHLEKARSFSAVPQHRDQEDDSPIKIQRPRDNRPYVYHHPLGRIVGAPGRRQRQGTQKLKIDAMKQPFEVIVMQDVREPEEKPVRPRNINTGAIVSSADIEREMAEEGVEPSQDEVNESINALRPDATLLEQGQFKELAKSLEDGFTIDQLHAFLTHSLNLSAVEADTVHLLRQEPSELQTRYRRTQWRPGRTRIEKRLPLGAVVKKSEKTNKPKLVEQILRLTWNLSIHAEEQQMGELELKLESWEMKYLFDLQLPNQAMMYESFIGSNFLMRACDVRPYRPVNYLRISGRRQDAEEVAQRLETELSKIEALNIDLEPFTPLLGSSGWPAALDKLFRAEDLKSIQERTFTIIEQLQPSLVKVHGTGQAKRIEARRNILALLELPGPGSIIPYRWPMNGLTRLPEAVAQTVHARYRGLELTRLQAPMVSTENTINAESSEGSTERPQRKDGVGFLRARLLRREMATIPPLSPPKRDLSARKTYWSVNAFNLSSDWKAYWCRVLHAKPAKSVAKSSAFTIANAQVQHLETLLSFFQPRQQDEQTVQRRAGPVLIARFMPSPYGPLGIKAMKTLPIIELTYKFFMSDDGKPDIFLASGQAILEKQELHVPLPAESTDIRFERWTRIPALITRMQNAGQVLKFTETLRNSLQEGPKSKLIGKAFVNFQLPAAWVRGQKKVEKGTPDEDYSYEFTGFEQTQKQEFEAIPEEALPAKMHQEDRSMLKAFRKGMYLQLRDVFAGTTGGRRTEVSLHGKATGEPEPKEFEDDVGGEEDGEADAEAEVVTKAAKGKAGCKTKGNVDMTTVWTALGVSELLTKIAAGNVKALIRHDKEQKVKAEGEDVGEAVDYKPDVAPETEGAGEAMTGAPDAPGVDEVDLLDGKQ